MTIAFDQTGSFLQNSNSTGYTIDITAAAVGAIVIACMGVGAVQSSVTTTGWTQLLSSNDAAVVSHYVVAWRQKLAGDTTFSWTLAASARGVLGWASYTGVDPTTPTEMFTANAHSSTVNYVSPTLTPSTANEWALQFSYGRETAATQTWTADGSLLERLDACNTVSAFVPQQIADSNGVVTAASHSYTAVASSAMTNGASILGFLNPAASVTNTNQQSLVVQQAALIRATRW